MNVSLTPRLEELISQKVESGLYNSASEVVRQALRLLIEKDTERQTKLEALTSAIQDGINSGSVKEWDLESFKQKLPNSKEKK